jgi:hypothetical protein
VRVLRPGKPDLEDATVLVRGRKIAAVGRKLTIPDNARRIDGTSLTLTAGWIDARGSTPLERTSIDDGISNAAHLAIDGIDTLDAEKRVRDAVHQGVTAVFIAAGRGLLSGSGLLVHLKPGESDPEKISVDNTEAASFVLGSARGEPTVARLSQLTNLRRTLRDAQKYRETVDQYQEDLQKYLEDKKKGLQPSIRPTQVESTDSSQPRPDRPPIPIPGRRRRPQSEEETGLLWVSRVLGIMPVVDDREGGFILDDGATSPSENGSEEVCGCGSPGPHMNHPPGAQIPEFFFQDNPQAPKPDSKGAERPKKPDFNPGMDALLPALRREVPVRIEAHRSDEIRAAIAIARDFRLRVVIEGADEAADVIEELGKSKLPVIVAPVREAEEPVARQRRVELCALLAEKGIPFAIGTGRNFYGTAWLRAQVAQAIAGGLDRDRALAAVTKNAAELIGIDEELGVVEAGKVADLTLFEGDPLEPGTGVKLVMIDGEIVYEK